MNQGVLVAFVVLIALLAQTATSQVTELQQCTVEELTLPKSIAFLNSSLSVQVGTVAFSYHEFGPFVDIVAEAQQEGVESEFLPEIPAPLLLIHGFGATQYDWPIELLETLAEYRKVVIFDNPRIGLSTDSSDDPLTIPYMADATLGLIEAIGLDRPDILGYSMGGDVALNIAVNHGDQIGGVVAVAASFGGPAAPQPAGGLDPVLQKLGLLFLSKYAAQDPSPSATTTPLSILNAAATAVNAEASTADGEGEDEDPYKLLFPLGSYDPGVCNLINDFISINYAAGNYPLDESAGYAVPEIIPSNIAIIPTSEALTQQADALMAYHSQQSDVAALLPDLSNQIMFISGVQDNVIPIITQLKAVQMTPGAWLLQIPAGGHGLPFLEPAAFAATTTSFLDTAQSLGPVPKSYYNTTASSGALVAGKLASVMAAIVAAMAVAIQLA